MRYRYCPLCAAALADVGLDGRVRQQCPACGFVFWDNPTPVVAAVVEHGGRVVLTRSRGWPEKWVGIVAGFMEKGETPEQAVLREVKEELGLEGEIAALIGHYSFEEKNQVITAFHVRAEGQITIGAELESIRLVPPEEVRPWRLGTGPALKDWLESRKKG